MKQFNIEEYLKNPSRKVITRDGRAVKIYCTNYYIGNRCIIAEIEGDSFSQPFYRNGKVQAGESNPSDLFFAPEKHEGWINIHKSDQARVFPSYIYQTKEDAEKYGIGKNNYITTIKIEWEE